MQNYKIPTNFDWKTYLLNNKDVARLTFFNSKEGAWKHWTRHGEREGRHYPTINEEINTIPTINEEINTIPTINEEINLSPNHDRKIIQSPKFSVIIPTMWKSNIVNEIILSYENNNYVEEIIIIDNNPNETPSLAHFNKVKHFSKGENIFVNPAWNWGASLAKYNIILANDDVLIHNLNDVFYLILNNNFDIVGLSPKKYPTNSIQEIYDFPANSYGSFMYVKNFIYIPDQLKMWYGDNVLFEHNKKRGILQLSSFILNPSTTINSDINYFRKLIGKIDIQEYKKMSPIEENHNFIIRTHNRPLFFQRCINSIKKFNPLSKIHTIVDNPDDLHYVEKNLKNTNHTIYLINQEITKELAKKIPIERTFFPYNTYFNIISPFIKGWISLLDDDDEVISPIDFQKNINNIYLFKVDIKKRIVPSESNFGKNITLSDISGIGIVFHHSQLTQWTPQRGGDFLFIKTLSLKYKPIWINQVLTSIQLFENFGNGKDIKDKKVSANIASYPDRKNSLIKTLNSIINHDFIDIIRVCLNEYDNIPNDLPKHPKIEYLIPNTNLKDSGKFLWASTRKKEYYFSCDDDLLYPEHYFIEHLILLKKYRGEIFVTLHGKQMKENPSHFTDNIKSCHCLKNTSSNEWVNNPGTGVMVFDNEIFVIPFSIFKYHGMTDLNIAKYCQFRKIPIICRKHSHDELSYTTQKDTLFDKRNSLHNKHMEILNDIKKWTLNSK